MSEHDTFGTSMWGKEMATRIWWSPHDHHRTWRGIVEVYRVSKYPPMHLQTVQNTNVHETTRKIKKISK